MQGRRDRGNFKQRGKQGFRGRGRGRGYSSGFKGKGRGGGRGRGGKGRGYGSKVMIIPHRHEGVFIARGQQEVLVTKNLVPGVSVYSEKRISVQNKDQNEKIEYRVWNPYRSKLGAAILGGVGGIYMKPGSKVLYLGAASGTTVSHVSDILGENGHVYAIEFSKRCGRDLVNLAKQRTNIHPIIEDARKPSRYRMLVDMVDCVFADVAQPDQGRIMAINCKWFLKNGGHFVISIKVLLDFYSYIAQANCIDSTNPAEVVFENEIQKMRDDGLTPEEYLTLEPYERDHAIVVGSYRPVKK